MKRIAAFLVLMQTKREDGHELWERLLDGTQTDFGGKPLRFFIDNDTWYGFWWAESQLPIVRSICRVIDRTGEKGDLINLTHTMRHFHETSGVGISVEHMRLNTFAYDDQDGATMMIVNDGSIQPTSILRCRKCGGAFDFCATAKMVTMEQVDRLFTSARGIIVQPECNLERPAPDLIVNSPVPSGTGIGIAAVIEEERWPDGKDVFVNTDLHKVALLARPRASSPGT